MWRLKSCCSCQVTIYTTTLLRMAYPELISNFGGGFLNKLHSNLSVPKIAAELHSFVRIVAISVWYRIRVITWSEATNSTSHLFSFRSFRCTSISSNWMSLQTTQYTYIVPSANVEHMKHWTHVHVPTLGPNHSEKGKSKAERQTKKKSNG